MTILIKCIVSYREITVTKQYGITPFPFSSQHFKYIFIPQDHFTCGGGIGSLLKLLVEPTKHGGSYQAEEIKEMSIDEQDHLQLSKEDRTSVPLRVLPKWEFQQGPLTMQEWESASTKNPSSLQFHRSPVLTGKQSP